MKIRRKSDGKHAVVLSLSGSIEGGGDADLFQTEIRNLLAEGRANVLLDLASVSWINSTGLGILIGGYTTLKRAGGSMKLLHLTERVESLFAVTKLNLVFEVYSDEVLALKSFRRDLPPEGIAHGPERTADRAPERGTDLASQRGPRQGAGTQRGGLGQMPLS